MRSCLLAGGQGRVEEASGELPAGCKAREVLITCPLAGRCASAGVLLKGVLLEGVPLAGVPLAVWAL